MIYDTEFKKINPYDLCVQDILKILNKGLSNINKNESERVMCGLYFLSRHFDTEDGAHSDTTLNLLNEVGRNIKMKHVAYSILIYDWDSAILQLRGSIDPNKDQKVIIVINGQGGSGKDSCVDIFKRVYIDKVDKKEAKYRRILNISSVDCVKEAAKTLGANITSKDDKYRIFLRKLKQLAIDYYDGPRNIIMKQIRDAEPNSIIFVHIREKEECDKLEKSVLNEIKESRFLKLLVISGSDRVTKADTGVDSLENVLSFDYDYVIENESTIDHLVEEVKKFMEVVC